MKYLTLLIIYVYKYIVYRYYCITFLPIPMLQKLLTNIGMSWTHESW